MTTSPSISGVTPTPFLRRDGDGLRQVARVTVWHSGTPFTGNLRIMVHDITVDTPVTVSTGESMHDAELAEITTPGDIIVELRNGSTVIARTTAAWLPPKHWVVHVVQLSHHDVGYTDLASHVLPEHDRWLDAAIDMAAATCEFPNEVRFRLVVEQCWSLDHFLRHAPPERTAAMLDLLRRGDIEMTALFGNQVTELCGHETLARSIYHAFRLKREFGIPLLSAEHNDIPGFTWGLSQVLTEAGIKLFCPGLPKYYNWGYPDATSFWDETAIFGAAGMPGAFWWEAPGGKRVLFWCNNQGCGGDSHPEMPGLAPRLQQLAEQGYPYEVLRWPVQGGARDNSPYIDGYTRTIRDWNARWAYPQLISSTNTRFYADLLPQVPIDLPVWHGELPGQDYPVGAASTAAATGVNRRNHADLPAAETLATMAGAVADYRYQDDAIRDAFAEILWHDEHTWGHHFPAGPTARASEVEKAVHAYRAAALAHDVASKAMARMADSVRLDEPGLHLVIFNSLADLCSGQVRATLREITNCGSSMTSSDDGRLHSLTLQDRHNEVAQAEIVAGRFELIDVETGAVVPYQLAEITSPYGVEPYSAQRLGLGKGGKRLGVFEQPTGILRNLVFQAEDVPALGYRIYRFQPRDVPPTFPPTVHVTGTTLENRWYRLEVDTATGCLRSLFDKETEREWVDATAQHPFGMLIIRDPFGGEVPASCTSVETTPSASIRVTAAAPGYPFVEITYSLPSDEKYLDVAVHLLQDPTPLQETYLAFPFHLPAGRFRYEGPLCIVDPLDDLLPGAYADRLTAQDWVMASTRDASVLWSSLDAPVVSLGRLWPGRVSPAHSAVVRADIEHPRPDVETLRGGTIYSLLTANNFGTNFAVSQCGDLLFRYRFTTAVGAMTDREACRLGQRFQTPLNAIMTARPGPRPLPPVGSFLTISHPGIRLLTLKRAEDGRGMMFRLWNPLPTAEVVIVSLPAVTLRGAVFTNLAEEDEDAPLEWETHAVRCTLPSGAVYTVRLLVDEAGGM